MLVAVMGWGMNGYGQNDAQRWIEILHITDENVKKSMMKREAEEKAEAATNAANEIRLGQKNNNSATPPSYYRTPVTSKTSAVASAFTYTTKGSYSEEEFDEQTRINKDEFKTINTTTFSANNSYKPMSSSSNTNTNSTVSSTQTTKSSFKPMSSPVTVKPKLNSELEFKYKQSKEAYNVAIKKFREYPFAKINIENEIKTLIVKNQNGKELILSLQREQAKLEYQQNIVSFSATDFKYESFKNEAKKHLTEKENKLKSEYGLNDVEIEQLKQDAQTALKTGVPTMRLSLKLDKMDAELKEQIIPKIKSIEKSISTGIKIGEPIAAGIIEMAYSNPKNELSESIMQYQNIDKKQLETIASKQQQLKDMQEEYNRLQKIFDKYGDDIINTEDDLLLIQFGDECKDALNQKRNISILK